MTAETDPIVERKFSRPLFTAEVFLQHCHIEKSSLHVPLNILSASSKGLQRLQTLTAYIFSKTSSKNFAKLKYSGQQRRT